MNRSQTFSAFSCMDGAFKYLVAHFRDFVRLATPPVIGLAIIETLLTAVLPDTAMGPPMSGTGEASGGFAGLAFFAVSCVLYVMFAVAWHRKYLIPAEVMTVGRALSWGREKTRFLLYFALSVLLVFVIAIPIMGAAILVASMIGGGAMMTADGLQGMSGVGMIPVVVAFIAIMAIFARLSLVFPAIAVGRRDFGFKAAWATTKGRSLGMLGVMILPSLLALVASIPVALIGLILGSTGLLGTLTGGALVALVGQGLSYVAIAFAVSALSAAYDTLDGTVPGAGGGQ